MRVFAEHDVGKDVLWLIQSLITNMDRSNVLQAWYGRPGMFCTYSIRLDLARVGDQVWTREPMIIRRPAQGLGALLGGFIVIVFLIARGTLPQQLCGRRAVPAFERRTDGHSGQTTEMISCWAV